MRTKHVVISFAVVLLGCAKDSVTDPLADPASGSLSFSFTGAGTVAAKSYSAVGAPMDLTGATGFGTTPWAAAQLDTIGNVLEIVAVVPKSSSTWDLAVVSIPQPAVGTTQVSLCLSPTCTQVFIILDATLGNDF